MLTLWNLHRHSSRPMSCPTSNSSRQMTHSASAPASSTQSFSVARNSSMRPPVMRRGRAAGAGAGEPDDSDDADADRDAEPAMAATVAPTAAARPSSPAAGPARDDDDAVAGALGRRSRPRPAPRRRRTCAPTDALLGRAARAPPSLPSRPARAGSSSPHTGHSSSSGISRRGGGGLLVLLVRRRRREKGPPNARWGRYRVAGWCEGAASAGGRRGPAEDEGGVVDEAAVLAMAVLVVGPLGRRRGEVERPTVGLRVAVLVGGGARGRIHGRRPAEVVGPRRRGGRRPQVADRGGGLEGDALGRGGPHVAVRGRRLLEGLVEDGEMRALRRGLLPERVLGVGGPAGRRTQIRVRHARVADADFLAAPGRLARARCVLGGGEVDDVGADYELAGDGDAMWGAAATHDSAAFPGVPSQQMMLDAGLRRGGGWASTHRQ